mgnify:CR=1 FL=1
MSTCTKSTKGRTKKNRQVGDVEEENGDDSVGSQVAHVVSGVGEPAHMCSVAQISNGASQSLNRKGFIHKMGMSQALDQRENRRSSAQKTVQEQENKVPCKGTTTCTGAGVALATGRMVGWRPNC